MPRKFPQLPEQRFSIARTARTWLRDSIGYRGLPATISELAIRTFEFLRDLTPSRRRLRFGDLQYDFDNGVDTTWSNVQLGTRLREVFAGEQYQPIESEQFHGILTELGLEYSELTFIDLGSGKGRALLLASEYPFRRIIGLEILPELHATAQQNVRRFSSKTQRCASIECWCGDARDYTFPNDPTLLYLFNPFFEPVLEQVLLNLEASLRQSPRNFVLLYVNPISEHLLSKTAVLRKFAGSHQYAAYVFDPPQVTQGVAESGNSKLHELPFPSSGI